MVGNSIFIILICVLLFQGFKLAFGQQKRYEEIIERLKRPEDKK